MTATTAVNIRTSPNTGSSILGVLHKGQRLTQVGAMKYGFVPVKFGSTTAYVSANYLAGAKASDASTGTAPGAKGDVFTSEPLNVRSGPGIKYSIHATLAKGSKVERTGLVRPELAAHIAEQARRAGLYAANMPEEVGGAGLDAGPAGRCPARSPRRPALRLRCGRSRPA